jgi:glycosyltransferase involved in cell wall biosynthesis
MVPLGCITDESQLVDIYRDCDALLFPSRLEGFSLVPLEAMACGKPVVAAQTSSLPEIVEDGVTGLLCPKDDIAAFTGACRKLAEDSQVLVSYGQAARSRVEKLFSEKVIVPQYIALYEKVAAEARSEA